MSDVVRIRYPHVPLSTLLDIVNVFFQALIFLGYMQVRLRPVFIGNQ